MLPSQPGRAPRQGDQVGPYTIVSTLGSGGKAVVYLAARADGFQVALKVLHPASLDTEDFKRFSREFGALQRMNHPNVVKVWEAGTFGPYPWLALEYVDGQDLMSLIEGWKQDPSTRTFRQVELIFRGLCAGLQYVHDHGLIHRDLKPNNVLITRDGVAKITDFGVVKDPHAMGTQLTVAGRLVGTVAFMAPEQIAGDELDHRADLYALGAVLYMMLTLRRPIEASSVAGYLARHLTEVPRAPSEVDHEVPRPLEVVCQRLLLKDPPQRFPSAKAVLDALAHPEEVGSLPLRGRDELLARWAARLSRLHSGEGGVVGIVGRANTGRTHTLQALAQAAKARDLRGALARGVETDLLRALARAVGIPDKPRPAEEHLAALASAARAAPLVLMVDDLDQASPEQSELLARLIRDEVTLRGTPVLLVFSAAALEGHVEALASGLLTDLPADIEDLEPLPREAILRMVRDLGVVGGVAPVLDKRLDEELGGLPGLVVQHVQALEERGWLSRQGDSLRAGRPLAVFRTSPLPVPEALRRAVQEDLAGLSADALDLLTALVLLDRAAPADTLLLCAGLGEDDRGLFDELAAVGCVHAEGDESERCVLSNPSVGMVLREHLDPALTREVHQRIALTLGGRRRRQTNPEVAHHLVLAGQPDQAWPIYLQAAKRALRARESIQAAEFLERATALCPVPEALEASPQPDTARLWLFLLRGEALAERGKHEEALPFLQAAESLARVEGDTVTLGRALAALGQTLHAEGDRDGALAVLVESTDYLEPGAPEWDPATRALGELRLHRGELDLAAPLWKSVLDRSTSIGSVEGEAHATLGLARLSLARGQLGDADRYLVRARSLGESLDSAVILSESLAITLRLDLIRGRYAKGVSRAETVLDLLHEREISEPLAMVMALQGALLLRSGDTEGAQLVTQSALAWRVEGRDWRASLLIARTLCQLGRLEEALAALPAVDDLPDEPLTDPKGQRAAIEAWTLAQAHPVHARELARWAVVRQRAVSPIEAAELYHTAARALLLAQDPDSARDAIKRALKLLGNEEAHGHRLEALVTLYLAVPDPRVVQAIGQLARAIAKVMPEEVEARFKERPHIRAALDKIR
ncbi:MAG: protein kinase [Deltaproteobacteria bacterium]|nr:protein kinase [Deltaproteobacteria bacterium]